MVIIRMVRVQHKLKVQQFQHRKIAVRVPHPRPKHPLVKRQRSPHIPHQQVHRKRPHPPPIIIRGHKRLARPRHRQRLTSSPRPSSPVQSPKWCQSPQIHSAPFVSPVPPKKKFPIPRKDTAPAARTSPSHRSSFAKSAQPAPSRHKPIAAKPPTATHSTQSSRSTQIEKPTARTPESKRKASGISDAQRPKTPENPLAVPVRT